MFQVVEETLFEEYGESFPESRALFDAVNEVLAHNRPNQLEGMPQLWETRKLEMGKWESLT